MDTFSPLVNEAFRLLHMDMYLHLEQVEYLADRCDNWSDDDAWTARELLEDLAKVVGSLLQEHMAGDAGGCQTCASPWPCPVVTFVHHELMRPDRHFTALLERANQARWARSG